MFSCSFETLWIMDLSSGIIQEMVKGSSKIIEICGQLINEKSSLVKEILPSQQLPQNNFSVEGISRAGLLYSVFLAETLDVVQDIDWVISLGNAFAKQYELYTYDDEHSALLHRVFFSYKCLGILLQKVDNMTYVRDKIVWMYKQANNLDFKNV
uniref:Uncharacterized protein n=1 Tax=Lactuca sativa TaxID=4236 RepID=A0A9R1XHT6_LACSA|nr:hypothetical protein LSAT_V11C400171630 [Lactuca sativa]